MSWYLFVLNVFLRMISVLPFKIVPENSVLLASFSLFPAHSPSSVESLLFLYYLSALFIPSVEHSCHFALLCKQISSLPSPLGCRRFLRA